MKKTSKIDLLNALVQMHCRSLPMYLASAAPWTTSEQTVGRALLQSIIADQGEIVDKFADVILQRDGIVERGAFPTEFTDLHDLSLDYLMHEMAEKQATNVKAIERATELLAGDDDALELCQRTLGVAKAHLDSLNEYVRDHSSP